MMGFRAGLAASLCVTLATSGCIPTIPEVREASARGGDFTLLSCDQLATAQGSVRQRIAALSPSAQFAFGVITPSGRPVEERRAILIAASEDLQKIRRDRGCVETAPVVTAAQVIEQPAETAPEVIGSGKYLQVATFEFEHSRDSAVAAFRNRGFATIVQPVEIAGMPHWRMLIGPLRTRADLVAADEAARSLGLNDAFLVDG